MSDITENSILSALPAVLKEDTSTAALAAAAARILSSRLTEISKESIYASIDTLPEALLDILAKDFNVEWYLGSSTLEEKRKTIKNAWQTHQKLGTKNTVEKALSSIYDGSKVEEWYEYSGQPYHFKILIDISNQSIDPEKYAETISRIKFYKNTRSVLDSIEFVELGATATGYALSAFLGESLTDGATAR